MEDKKIREVFSEDRNKEHEEISKLLDDNEVIALFNKLSDRPAYLYCVDYAKSLLKEIDYIKDGNQTKELRDMSIHRFGWANVFLRQTDKDINKDLRLLEVDDDLMNLIESTDNEVFYRPLFFPKVFINRDFEFEGLIIKGIMLVDNHYLPEEELGKEYLANGTALRDDYNIFFVAVDKKKREEFYRLTTLSGIENENSYSFLEYESEVRRSARMLDYVKRIVVNIIDMVEGNNDDLDVVTIETTYEQNLKREKRGQIHIPTKVYIRPKDAFKQYVRTFNENRNSMGYSHKFLVRGTMRHYRSDRYLASGLKGTKKWIKPFYKGQGILINKEYKIVESN